jgi:hypothetical protein
VDVIVALAGRRVDAPDAKQARFPLGNADAVAERLSKLFRNLKPQALVCSAACGADLLALDAARNIGIRRRIVLPFAGAKFRSTSVVDRPGEWGPLFDSLHEEALAANDLIVVTAKGNDDEAFAAATERIIEEASRLADVNLKSGTVHRPAEARVAVVVWERASRGDGDQTAHFASVAESRGFRLVEINTLEQE